MISGIGDLNHPPAPPATQGLRTIPLEPACATPPSMQALQAFALFQWMTIQQASALGLSFTSSAEPGAEVTGVEVLVWRSGRIAACDSPDGRTRVLYGSEWDLGLAVDEHGVTQRPNTFNGLQRQVPAKRVIAIGSSANGFASDSALPRMLQAMVSSAHASRSDQLSASFFDDFRRTQTAGATAVQQSDPLQRIGYLPE